MLDGYREGELFIFENNDHHFVIQTVQLGFVDVFSKSVMELSDIHNEFGEGASVELALSLNEVFGKGDGRFFEQTLPLKELLMDGILMKTEKIMKFDKKFKIPFIGKDRYEVSIAGKPVPELWPYSKVPKSLPSFNASCELVK